MGLSLKFPGTEGSRPARERDFVSVWKLTGLVATIVLAATTTAPLLGGGYPRADQLDFVYRLRAMQFDVSDLISHLDWNRSVIFWTAHSPDALLFRPLSYLVNGSIALVAGDRFFLPVLVNFLLNLGVAACLYILLYHATSNALIAFGLVATLTTSPFALELVAWTHLPGYLAFAFCTVLFCLVVQRALMRQHLIMAFAGAGLLCLSSFFYELGSALALLFGICLVLGRHIGGWPWLRTLDLRNFFLLIAAYGFAALAMPTVSLANYLSLYGAQSSGEGTLIHFNSRVIAELIGIWSAQWLVPLTFTLDWGTRLNWIPETWPVVQPSVLTQVAFAAVLVTCLVLLTVWKTIRDGPYLIVGFVFLLGAPLAYTVLLAGGRATNFNDLIAVLRINTYYLYFFVVIVLASIGFLKTGEINLQQVRRLKRRNGILVLAGMAAVGVAATSLPTTVQLAASEPGRALARERLLYDEALTALHGSSVPLVIDTGHCDIARYPWLLDTSGRPFEDGAGITSVDALLYGRTVLTTDGHEIRRYRLCE